MTFSKIIRENKLEKEERNESKKVFENSSAKKQALKSSFQKKVQNKEKMEADSSQDDDIILIKEEGKKSSLNKKFSKAEYKKVKNLPKPSSKSEKRKRAWESESSDSECLEVVLDNDAKKFVGLTPKRKFNPELKITPIVTPKRAISSQDSRIKRDSQNILGYENPFKELTPKSNTTLSFGAKPSLMIKNPEPGRESGMDFLESTEQVKQRNAPSSPYLQRNEAPGTPQAPLQRKFFKTPLKERDLAFKKPQQPKMWF